MASTIKTLLLDIEGTICPIAFVKDVLYPYAYQTVLSKVPTLQQHFPLTPATSSSDPNDNDLLSYLKKFPSEVTSSPDTLIAHISSLIERDIKDTALKSLQGYLWKFGYESGEIKAPLFADVVPAIKKYSKELENGVSIYSSGSVPAQILLFKYVLNNDDPVAAALDINPYLTSYFDTVNAGPKTVTKSYTSIAEQLKLQPKDILFLSDNALEIDAALAAGFQAYLTVRPGNAPVPEALVTEKNYKVITTLENLL
ncbi:hypothetical protein DV451_003168 [Geotrichum candidum]|uniref:Enolase-phosphatase E1 n=1 Tax=Geotrichum candidum TaxID=1173061 RepID=A0A9P5KTT9_GEOCN|nr:hypothetical protein DV451_003168 [Geotrichum candidum]KAF5111510.1 hypothetical protein DV453_000155 [Geotrichum candidum]